MHNRCHMKISCKYDLRKSKYVVVCDHFKRKPHLVFREESICGVLRSPRKPHYSHIDDFHFWWPRHIFNFTWNCSKPRLFSSHIFTSDIFINFHGAIGENASLYNMTRFCRNSCRRYFPKTIWNWIPFTSIDFYFASPIDGHWESRGKIGWILGNRT